MGFELVEVTAGYDGAAVLRGFSLAVAPGRAVVVAAGDGGGKTTLARVAAGFLRPVSGRVAFDGRDLTGRPAHCFARWGVVLAAPDLLNGRLTVADNLLLAARYGAAPQGTRLEGLYGGGRGGAALRRRVAWALERFPALIPRARQTAASLSSGQRVMLAVARALCAAPRVLILDEPATGLAPDTLERVAGAVKEIAAAGGSALITDAEPERWGWPVVRLEG